MREWLNDGNPVLPMLQVRRNRREIRWIERIEDPTDNQRKLPCGSDGDVSSFSGDELPEISGADCIWSNSSMESEVAQKFSNRRADGRTLDSNERTVLL